MLYQFVQILILLAILVSAFKAIESRDLFISVVYLAAMSLMVAIEFYILQAPDVAIAEAAVGAGLSSVIYIIAIYKTKRFE